MSGTNRCPTKAPGQVGTMGLIPRSNSPFQVMCPGPGAAATRGNGTSGPGFVLAAALGPGGRRPLRPGLGDGSNSVGA